MDHRKSKRVPEKIYFCFIDYHKAFDCVDHNNLWKILKEMGIPDHLTCLLRNLYAGQEAPGLTGRLSLGRMKQGRQRLLEFCQENTLVIANTLFQQHKRKLYTWTSPDGQHQNHLIIFSAAKDREALYSQQKQDRELTVAWIMNSLLPNSE